MSKGAGVVLGVLAAGAAGVGLFLWKPWEKAAASTSASGTATAPGATAPGAAPSATASPPASASPTTRVSHDLRYTPGSTVVTELTAKDKTKVAESWTVGADGVTLTSQGPAVPMTPALAAQRDASRKAATRIHPGAAPSAASPASTPGPAGTAAPASPLSALSALPPLPPIAGLPAGLPTTPAGVLAATGAASKLLGGASPLASLLPAAGASASPSPSPSGSDAGGGGSSGDAGAADGSGGA